MRSEYFLQKVSEDWTIPDEWTIRDAFIVTPSGSKICDFKKLNLSVMGYSTPIDMEMDLDDLEEHLHSQPKFPEATPYVTSYYKRNWGFAISEIE